MSRRCSTTCSDAPAGRQCADRARLGDDGADTGRFLPIVSQPAFSGRSLGVGEVAELLLRNVAHAKHRLLAPDFGFEQVLGHCSGGVVGHRQTTDAYLLTAAIRNDMKLLTFDTGLPALLRTAAERQHHITLLEP